MPSSRIQSLERRAWLLWGVTFALIIALTAAMTMVYVPALVLLRGGDASAVDPRSWAALAGLAGLVAVFCLYTALKQRELNRLRDQLQREEQERESVRTRLSELTELFRVSTALQVSLTVENILEIIVRRLVCTLQAQQASVMILDQATGVLATRASYGLESEFARHGRVRLGEGIAGWVAEQRRPVQLGPAEMTGRFQRHVKRNRNITSAISLPLCVGDRCVGVLNVNRINHTRPFEPHHAELLEMFAEHVAAVIERAETMERLGTQARELEADNRRLQESHRLKDVFLGTATHELKTPLTSVIAYAELLDDNDSRLSREQRNEFLRRLRTEAARLLALIDEILDLTRLETGKFVLKRASVSLSEIAHGAVETTRASAARHGVALVEAFTEPLPPVFVDEVKMRQVVTNLIVNAIKFSPEQGAVRVRTARDGDWLTLEISDRGPGVPPDETAHIFELFGQSVTVGDERDAGLGIGLHLVKRITELHGGHVGVNSTEGHGSTFWVRLPLPVGDDTPAPEDRAQAA